MKDNNTNITLITFELLNEIGDSITTHSKRPTNAAIVRLKADIGNNRVVVCQSDYKRLKAIIEPSLLNCVEDHCEIKLKEYEQFEPSTLWVVLNKNYLNTNHLHVHEEHKTQVIPLECIYLQKEEVKLRWIRTYESELIKEDEHYVKHFIYTHR